MIDSGRRPETYERLMQSPNWIPFYDDGRVVMFGRADAPEPDLTAFKNNRLEPELRAYKVSQPVPSADRPPTPTTWLDDIFRNRSWAGLSRTRMPPCAGSRVATFDETQPSIPDPARCLLAIREARTALATNPDDSSPTACSTSPTASSCPGDRHPGRHPADAGEPAPDQHARAQPRVLSTRFQQRVTALNYAIQTTPPPHVRRGPARAGLAQPGAVPALPPGRLSSTWRGTSCSSCWTRPTRTISPRRPLQYAQQLDQLNQRVKQIEDVCWTSRWSGRPGPIEKASYARSQGASGLAIGELEEADRGNMSPVIVKPQLVDLYCNTGQPDRALELLAVGAQRGPEPGQRARARPSSGRGRSTCCWATTCRPRRSGRDGRSPASASTQHAGPHGRPDHGPGRPGRGDQHRT